LIFIKVVVKTGTFVTSSAREHITPRQLLEQLKKTAPVAHGLVLTTLPRGGLQIMQPSTVTDNVVKSYATGLHAEDCLTWQSILKRKPQRLSDCWTSKELESTGYFHTWLQPMGLAHAVALPMGSPALDGYPGAVHLCRTAEQGEFSSAEVHKLNEVVAHFDEKLAHSRATRRNICAPIIPGVERPRVRLTILDGNLKPKSPAASAGDVDDRLREQMVEQAKRRIHQLNGDSSVADRVMLADSHGDRWPYRIVTFRSYPALGQGPFSFFCLQPDCGEWGILRPADFQADTELVRLIPALRYMQQEFHRGPTLVDVAKTVHLSPFHFHRRFTELLGLTPKQFLLDCQIYLAKTELLAGEKELATIAKECGFAHQSHFTSRFKQATGYTPTRWRKMALARRQFSDN
jgi:AraC-like DNA-binding protein